MKVNNSNLIKNLLPNYIKLYNTLAFTIINNNQNITQIFNKIC